MRVALLAPGTRGDLQPHLALGIALQQAGYSVTVATVTPFRPIATQRGLDFAPMDFDPQAVLQSEAGQAWLASGGSPLRFISTWRQITQTGREVYEQALATAWVACQDADAIIYAGAFVAGHFIAEALGLPEIWTLLQPLPLLPSGELPAIFVPPIPALGSSYNRLTNKLFEYLFWQALKAPTNHWRRDTLGLAPLSTREYMGMMCGVDFPILHAYSPHVSHAPTDWPDNVHVTGYWFLDQPTKWQPPAELVEFLESEPAPIYVGFGSMGSADLQRELGIVLDSLAETGQRGVLVGNDMAIDRLPETVFAAESLPHDWLFPRVRAAIHHGGAGTTAASLRAGIPTITIPFFLDQPYWGRQVFELGAGPRPILRRKLSVSRLSAAIRTALKPDVRSRATEVGASIRGENGVARAVEVIDQYLRS